jgi:hypothetical protein
MFVIGQKNVKHGQSRLRNLCCTLMVIPVVKSTERERGYIRLQATIGVTQQA